MSDSPAENFSLFEMEKQVIEAAEASVLRLTEVASGVDALRAAYRQSYQEQRRLVRLSDRMQEELQAAKTTLAEMLAERTAELDRRNAELAMAHALQLSLLPPPLTEATPRGLLSIDLMLDSAKEIGGDLVDHFRAGETLHVVILGDVSEKGAGAALVMARTNALFRGLADRPDAEELFRNPAVAMALVNRPLAAGNESCMFVTVQLVVLDLETGRLDLVSAGHLPPYLRRRDGTVERLVDGGGLPLGIADDAVYGVSTARLDAGDRLLIVTDGITEAVAAGGTLFGSERVVDWFAASQSDLPLSDLVSQVRAYEQGAPPSDDIAAILVGLSPA